jgi:predicted Ser/Thr protein kinase
MEDTINRIVGFFRHTAQGLEERKQILYLLEPSLAERLKSLMEVYPIYVLKAGDEVSPVFERPLSLFDPETLGPIREQLSEEVAKRYLEFIKAELVPRYAEFIGHEIQKAYLESYADYGQNLFDRYVDYADAWIEDQDFKDPDTCQLLNRELLNQELTKIKKPAGIANPKDFRNEVVKFSLRSRAQNAVKNPSWTSTSRSCSFATPIVPSRSTRIPSLRWGRLIVAWMALQASR